MSDNVEHTKLADGGKFAVLRGGQQVAEMTYKMISEGLINIDHTEVDKGLRGQGIALDMLNAAITQARANGWKIRATCPFAHKRLAAEPAYSDVFSG